MGKVMGDITGANSAAKKAARAAGGAALAQQAEARAAFDEFSSGMRPATTQSLAQLDQSIAAQERNLARQEKLAEQIDPALLEASQQALQLLRGEESKSLAPVRRQRDMQRQKLLNSLREQLGPGAETSSAGIQALTSFDAETDNLLAGTQQSALGQLGNFAGQWKSIGDTQGAIGGLAQLAQGRFGVQQSASEGLFRARQPLLGSAGAQFVGAQVRAQHQLSQANQFGQLGMMAAGAYLGGGLGALGAQQIGGLSKDQVAGT